MENVLNIGFLWLLVIIFYGVRIFYLFKTKGEIVVYREAIFLLFSFYIVSLFYLVTFKDVNFSDSNFTLFREIFRYEIGSRLFIKNVIGNVLLFIPFGVFVTYYFSLKKVRFVVVLSCLMSFLIESGQLFIGRVFDVDDILLNVCGGIFGFFAFYVLCTFRKFLN